MPYGKKITITLDGKPVTAFEGDSIAAVLLMEDRLIFGRTPSGRPRGLYCGMGNCYECVVMIDGTTKVRACITRLTEGMAISTEPLR